MNRRPSRGNKVLFSNSSGIVNTSSSRQRESLWKKTALKTLRGSPSSRISLRNFNLSSKAKIYHMKRYEVFNKTAEILWPNNNLVPRAFHIRLGAGEKPWEWTKQNHFSPTTEKNFINVIYSFYSCTVGNNKNYLDLQRSVNSNFIKTGPTNGVKPLLKFLHVKAAHGANH